MFHYQGLPTFPGNLKCIWGLKTFRMNECLISTRCYKFTMPEVNKYHQFTLVCKQINALAPGTIWAIPLIQKLQNFANKLICITSNIQFFQISDIFWSLITKVFCAVVILIHYCVKIGAKIDQPQRQIFIPKL